MFDARAERQLVGPESRQIDVLSSGEPGFVAAQKRLLAVFGCEEADPFQTTAQGRVQLRAGVNVFNAEVQPGKIDLSFSNLQGSEVRKLLKRRSEGIDGQSLLRVLESAGRADLNISLHLRDGRIRTDIASEAVGFVSNKAQDQEKLKPEQVYGLVESVVAAGQSEANSSQEPVQIPQAAQFWQPNRESYFEAVNAKETVPQSDESVTLNIPGSTGRKWYSGEHKKLKGGRIDQRTAGR